MHISSKSWHMRVDRWVIAADYTPKNLCQHFWTTMLSGLAFIGVVVTVPVWWSVRALMRLLGKGVGGVSDWSTTHDEGLQAFGHWAKKWIAIPLGAVALLYLVAVAGFLLWLLGYWILHHPMLAGVILAGIAGGLSLVVGLIIGWKGAGNDLQDRPTKKRVPRLIKMEKPIKEPSLFWEWFWAKKHKVCPLITVNEQGSIISRGDISAHI